MLEEFDLLTCPVCHDSLRLVEDQNSIRCVRCSRSFPIDQGIPMLFWPNEWDSTTDVTEVVKEFYEATPFPNYDDMDSPESLRSKAEKGLFARLLNEQIPYGARILECGCGTGQLSNFLGLTWGRRIVGTDICMNSLRLGKKFKDEHDIQNVSFVQMNLFQPVFAAGTFGIVICNGVLHHTSDPFRGFQSLIGCLRTGGFVIVGLYNRYGRLPTDIRRFIFGMTGDRLLGLDPRLRLRLLSDVRKRAWFMDQYRHPHETKHTFGQVLGWFEQCGVEFVSSIPKFAATESFSESEKLFEPHDKGTRLDRLFAQLGILVRGGAEGGFFTVIGRKSS